MPDYDHSYKQLFSHPELIRDLLKGFIRERWTEELDLDTLEKINNSYVSDDLREREDDCLVLTEHFINKFNQRYDRTVKGCEPAIAEIFRNFHWPGNVRELENLLERIFVLETDDRILVKHIPPRIMREVEAGAGVPTIVTDSNFANKSFQDATSAFQTSLIQNALTQSNGKLSDAADMLGLSRHALRHQMNKLHMR